MTAKRPGQITHLPVVRLRDDAATIAQKTALRERLAKRGVRVRRDVAAWMTVAELASIGRAATNATDRYVAERFDYGKETRRR